jgi:glycosyltransferase involved in cell wall biosynthesis
LEKDFLIMSKLLFLIENLEYNGLARQCTILAKGMQRAGHAIRVCALRHEGPFAVELRQAGVTVVSTDWTRWLSLGALMRLRSQLESFAPDVIHAWGLPALRSAALVWHGRGGRRAVSRPLPPGQSRVSCVDRWLLGQAQWVAAGSDVEAKHLLALGVDPPKLATVPPAVEAVGKRSDELATTPGRPFLLCVGPFERWKGYQDALWAFDILHYLYPELGLVFVGAGLDEASLRQFRRGLGARGNIHFLGAQSNVAALMRRAELVWVPSRRAGGAHVVLEALAAGTPVIATRIPELAALLAPLGEELLVPPGDPPALVRKTRQLLEDAERRRLLADRGRHLVASSHTAEQLVGRYEGLYHKRAG